MKAVVGGIVHESNTFATQPLGAAGTADFEVFEGGGLVAALTGTNTPVGGYLAAARDAGMTVLPTLYARAEPAGAIDPDTYCQLERRLLAGLEPGQVILLDLHGAGVIAPGESLELRLLRAVRAVAGWDVTIAITLDLHGNLPECLADLADVIVGCRHYPHTDMAERASLAARIAGSCASPISSVLRLPLVLPPSPTGSGPAAELRELARAAELEPGVLACTVFHGFPYADTAQAGASVVTVTDGDLALADRVNQRIAAWLWRERARFLAEPLPAAEAVAMAAGPGPLVLGDAADNPGGGGCGDGTYLLRAVLDSGKRACFATLHDPAAVSAAVLAGTGATFEVELGGRHGTFSGPPVRVTATVRALTDGRVVRQSVRSGTHADFGPSARLAIGNAEVIVASRRLQVMDPEIFLLHGVLPERYQLVAVKSAYHFRAGFSRVGSKFAAADAPGLTTRYIERLPRHGPSARLWPVNRSAVFSQAATAETAGLRAGLTTADAGRCPVLTAARSLPLPGPDLSPALTSARP
ncbi:MAG TPA: M81 family metallopeptidase [Streptosporangiaceae bacterium]|nr:M81 family metallopeptidase [Streptosporangiaceae bacterium]